MKDRLIQWWTETARPGLANGWLEFRSFITSFFFLKHFAGIIAMVFALFFLTLWWMRCYTHHGESLQVHNYVGLTLEEATEMARNRSFRIQVTDSLWVEGKDPGEVLEQNPKEFSRVKENRTIYLTITKEVPEEVTLPTLVGNYDYTQYKKRLSNKGLKATIRERVFDNKQAENTILYLFYGDQKITETDLKEGIKIPKGETLEFVVTERGAGTVQLPDLRCKKFTAAEFLISSLELSLGDLNADATVVDQANAFVYKQVPPSGQVMRVGEQVTLYLTQDTPAGCGTEEGEVN
jgi:UDP-N-acetylmuramate--alanine ligase